MQNPLTFNVKRLGVLADCHSTEVYDAIYEGKLPTVPGVKPYQIPADAAERWLRIRQAKRALAQEERQLASISA